MSHYIVHINFIIADQQKQVLKWACLPCHLHDKSLLQFLLKLTEQ